VPWEGDATHEEAEEGESREHLIGVSHRHFESRMEKEAFVDWLAHSERIALIEYTDGKIS
jgi:hypothetical protein